MRQSIAEVLAHSDAPVFGLASSGSVFSAKRVEIKKGAPLLHVRSTGGRRS